MATKTTTKKKRGTDIPLDNIPDRSTGKTFYPDEFKRAAAERVTKGESAEEVARELNIPSSSLILKWKRQIELGEPLNKRAAGSTPVHHKSDNVASMLRAALAQATKARDERLEAAAFIVENDGGTHEAQAIAKKIRAFKRHT